MSPSLNDQVENRQKNIFSNQKIVRMVSAFLPLNYAAAQAFITDRRFFPVGVEADKAERCLSLVFKEYPTKETGVNEIEAENLKAVASIFINEVNKTNCDKLKIILNALENIYPAMSRHQIYTLLYRGFFGKVSGPRLASWLNIHKNDDIYKKLNSPVLVSDLIFAAEPIQHPATFNPVSVKRTEKMPANLLINDINFLTVQDYCSSLVFSLRAKTDEIVSSLSDYQCSNVTLDEINRACDLLENIHINKEYFKKSIRGVTSFLPLNQPLYASVCFGFIPALMAENVCIRPPTAMHKHYKKLMSVINLPEFCSSLEISYDEKDLFLSKRVNVTDAIIFTGTPENAAKVRKHFRKNVLFILNGAGHNPLVVSEDACLEKAIQSSLSVVLYNQGQDCAGPNAILVHKNVFTTYTKMLLDSLNNMTAQVGDYKSEGVIVGPNSDPDHTLKVSNAFKTLRNYCIYGGEINPVSGLIKPTVFVKPLKEGGNYKEFFSPVFFLQPYDEDDHLADYFSSADYKNNAMYISLFGTSNFINDALPEELHNKESILSNTDLHQSERGFLPYGGSGPAASCVWINGERISGSTLPQRDIFNHLVKPYLALEGNICNAP